MRARILRHTSSPPLRQQLARSAGRRHVHISASPAANANDELVPRSTAVDVHAPDAQFEVLGSPYSLLSASLAASQTLYTRRGTLVGVSGKPENAISSLTPLNPLERLPQGIPFLYQKINSASPMTCLISTRSPVTSFTTVHLDGTTDWQIAQRKGLLAWTGQTLSLSASTNIGLDLAHWGQTRVTGRGLLALTGTGQIYQVRVAAGEEYIAHPANVLAYSINRSPPSPYRFKSSVLRFQVPGVSSISRWIPDINFFKVMKETETWKRVTRIAHVLRTWSRRTIWGDRLFLRFHGPTTILLQTRASRLADTLTAAEVNEIASVAPGALTPKKVLEGQTPQERAVAQQTANKVAQPTLSYVTVRRDTGEVKFDDVKKTVEQEQHERAEKSNPAPKKEPKP